MYRGGGGGRVTYAQATHLERAADGLSPPRPRDSLPSLRSLTMLILKKM